VISVISVDSVLESQKHMNRRTWLWSFAAALLAAPLRRLKAFARVQAPALSGADVETLDSIAEIVLPSDLGADGRQRVVGAFVTWIKDYKEGADRGYGYGASTLSAPAGPSPAGRYPEQFAAFEATARSKGAASFAALPADARRAQIEASLGSMQGGARLPARPTGTNLIADLMGFYFNSADAWNLAYRARIDRDSCRALAGSEQPPAPLGSR
jgi:hypothetical protein